MSKPNLGPLLAALDALKEDYTCNVCKELCKDPVSLSTCFHLICAEHCKDLTVCPTCKVPLPLDGCKIFKDTRLQSCIESAKELDIIFAGFRDTSTFLQISKLESSSSKISAECIQNTSGVERSKRQNGNLDMFKRDRCSVERQLKKTPTKRNKNGETALHIACYLGEIDKVTELLNGGADTNEMNNMYWTPLHKAVQNGSLYLVKLLLQYKTLVNVPDLYYETPLHVAAQFKRKEIIEELLKNGADRNARNCYGETPADLGSGELKRALGTSVVGVTQTQDKDTLIAEWNMERACNTIKVFCASTDPLVHNRLKLLCKYHRNLRIEPTFWNGRDVDRSVRIQSIMIAKYNFIGASHLVVDADLKDKFVDHNISWFILLAIANSNWILTSEWVLKSTEQQLAPFKDHLLVGTNSKIYQGPLKSMYNEYKLRPRLFHGCYFYIQNVNSNERFLVRDFFYYKYHVTTLISKAGGVVLRLRPNPEQIPDNENLVPYHDRNGKELKLCSYYIIFIDHYEPMDNMQCFKARPVSWLFDCIERYELIDP